MFLYVLFGVMDPDLEITKYVALSPRKIKIRIRHVQIRILILTYSFFKSIFFIFDETLSVESDVYVYIHIFIFFINGEKKQFQDFCLDSCFFFVPNMDPCPLIGHLIFIDGCQGEGTIWDYMESWWYWLCGSSCWLAHWYSTTIHLYLFLTSKPALQCIYLSFSLLPLRAWLA